MHPGRLGVKQSQTVFEAGMTWLCVETLCQALCRGKALSRVCLRKPTPLHRLREIPEAPTKLAVALRQIPVLTPWYTAEQAGTLSRLSFPICLACIKGGKVCCSTAVDRKHCWVLSVWCRAMPSAQERCAPSVLPPNMTSLTPGITEQ